MRGDLDRVLFTEDQIAARVGEIADALARDLQAELEREGADDSRGHIALIPIMTGALFFAADLLRRLPMKLSVDLVTVSSYPGRSLESRGAKIESELPPDLAGKHVVIIDDILDSGRTMMLVRDLARVRSPASVRTVVMLDKPARRVVDIQPDYKGFDVPDEFVVGYGLDFDGYYRNLTDIAVIKPENLQAERDRA